MNGAWRTLDDPGTPRWARAGVPFFLVLMLGGLLAGLLVAHTPLLQMAGIALVGAALLAAILRWPELGPALFWLVYALQYTVFSGLIVTGLYYPIYALMAINAFIALARHKVVLSWRLAPYVLFLLTVLVSLLPLLFPLEFAGKQRLFIYVLGFLVYFQFPTKRVSRTLVVTQVIATLVIVGWVVVSSANDGFVRRAGIVADQNDTSFILSFGLLAMLARLAARRLSLALSIVLWALTGTGIYALLLLASRGIGIAFAVSALVILGRSLVPLRRSLPLLLALAVAGVVIFNLPGSNSLFQRFQSADVATANERIPLWRATIHALEGSNAYELLLGHGFQSAEPLIRRVSVTLTSTHNVYLQLMYDEGLIGVLAFLTLHMVLLWRFVRTRSFITLYGASAAVLMLMGDLSLTAANNFLYWVATGYLLAIASALDRREAAAPEGA